MHLINTKRIPPMSSTTYPRLLVETVQGVTVAAFTDDMLIAEEVIRDLDEQLAGLVDVAQPTKILLNFREVRTMSSSVLAILLKLHRKLAAVQGQLKLCCVAPDLLEIFRITRFDRLFEIHEEEWAALDSFR